MLREDFDVTKWEIPIGVSIPAGNYLLFWADGEEEQSDTHTNFKISKSGEEIGLFDTDENGNAAIDTVTFGEQTTDISYGRICDGEEPWVFFENSTPGYSNSKTTTTTEGPTTKTIEAVSQ